MCEDAAATCSQRRSPRHWGRLEATTRGNATLKLAAEPAWAAAFQPRQAAEDDEVAVPAALGVPGAPQAALPHLPVLSQAAWHAEQLASDFGSGGGGAQLHAERLLQVVGRLMGPGVAGVAHLQRQHPGMQRRRQDQEIVQQRQLQGQGIEQQAEQEQQLLGFWGTALLAVMCSEGGQGVSALVE